MARKKTIRQASNWLNASIVGIQFPVAMALGYFWGKWMDGLFGTEPWLTIIFSILGVIAGLRESLPNHPRHRRPRKSGWRRRMKTRMAAPTTA